MPTLSLHLDDATERFVRATGNPSTYMREVIQARMMEYAEARLTLDKNPHAEPWTRPALMAALDAVNGLFWTDGMAEADQARANIEDTPGLAAKWGLDDAQYARLVGMTDREGRALRVVAEEFWAGRGLD